MPETAAPQPRAPRTPRSRRTPRISGEERERAILATAERLLAEHGLEGFSVDDLARGAGLSRPTFYFYFASKDAVVLALLDRVIEQAVHTPLVLDFAGDPVGSWRAVIQNVVDVFSAHRVVAAAAVRAHPSSAEVRALWAEAMERWIAQTADLIEAERVRGAARAGQPARELAVALNLMNERTLAATFTGEQPAVTEDAVVDVLLAIWLPAIYGTHPAPQPRSRRRPARH
ncbi:transcriptional regulator, TetR family [Jatrophihabitans endophyticus]|uniref:Transcriptional regulator, TetR family n=1 Tax=Jatrophihabitans endophyticus TaxID=1206085 RepID=A0A1M5PDY0_9ACTN|nr:TetR/AcrR family transcriptional regulator [Jatrophihabitans endophyticus]SHG99932.1 transcriptional regulator, TetR family [Jatrophihabitans endophyticus]